MLRTVRWVVDSGAFMLRAVRHNLRAAVRLSVLLVLLGLGTVPVECAAVYGPHSIFITAEAVAHVRDGGHQHAHGVTPAHDITADMAMPDEHAAVPDAHPSDPSTVTSKAGVTSSLPTPAGTAVDALIALALFESDSGPGPRDFATISRLLPLPMGNSLPAPEPPPPQTGS